MSKTEIPLILVIDDQPQNLLILSATLRQAGYQVAAANRAAVAFKILSKLQPSLILCDVIMPEMDGYDFCRSLQADPLTAEIPFIFLTGRTEAEQIAKGFEAGALDYITKPFNPQELLARVQTHIELKTSKHQLKLQKLALQALKDPLLSLLTDFEKLETKAPTLSPPDLEAEVQSLHQNTEQLLLKLNQLLDAL